jgi:hypothetical protein
MMYDVEILRITPDMRQIAKTNALNTYEIDTNRHA